MSGNFDVPSYLQNRDRSDTVCIFIPTLTAGGAERVASILANIWCLEKRVVVITLFEHREFFEIDSQVEVICIGLNTNEMAVRRSTSIIRAIFSMRSVVKRIRPLFVLSFMNKYNAFCVFSLFGVKIPVIVSERGSPYEALPRIRVIARDLLYPKAAGIICQTAESEGYFLARLKVKNIGVIPNPVAPLIEHSERRPEKIVLGVGRFWTAKGTDHLIKAFHFMSDKRWKLVLCGDGPLKKDLKKLAVSLGVRERILFVGEVKKLGEHYRTAGIFVMPSLHEGFPNSLAEAIVSGLPCVSYDCKTGPSELIQHGVNGLLVPVGDFKALGKAMDGLSQDDDYAMQLGKTASKLSRALDPDVVAARYMEYCLLCIDR